jgi:putative membrane protein insertion efficiency factor
MITAERTSSGEAGRSGDPRVATGVVAGWMASAIRTYQLARSGRPTGCRYLPTCSEYAVEAIAAFGAVRGSALAARRLARCTPWGGHGVDPVPEGKRS